MNFKKLDLDLSDLDLLDFNSGICVHNPNKLGLSYYKLKSEGQHTLLEHRLPLEFQNKNVRIFYCIMTGPGKLLPHIDTHTTTSINYYIKSGNGVTTFYTDGIPHPTVKNAFIDQSVNELERFVANDNDCYILDVSKIHNVELPSNEYRHFINFAFKDTV